MLFLSLALILAVLGFADAPGLWFCALVLGLAGASRISRGLEARRAIASESPAVIVVAAPPVADPEAARVNELAERLIRELERGPQALREIVRKPRETIEECRRGWLELLGREGALRSACSAGETARIDAERKTLIEKIGRAADAAAKSGYELALVALELQQRELASMANAADRLEAERARLRLTLERLHAQAVRARAVHGAEGMEELRRAMERLAHEVGAQLREGVPFSVEWVR